MHHVRYAALFLAVAFGLFLLEGGITGMVISQSCCFPGEGVVCAPEDACRTAELQQPAPAGYTETVVGALLVLLAFVLLLGELRRAP